ncbi:MAG: type II secretion system protein [Opitutales bacterium]
MNLKRRKAFTLIELLTVIAIIGILAGILIPAVGAVRKQANIAASKAQLSNYVNAIQMFKGEYNYFPFSAAHEDGGATIGSIGEADFVGALSATLLSGGRIESGSENYGNRRLIAFYTFSESDFSEDDVSSGDDASSEDDASTRRIADRFGNTNIYIAIDGDGDGQIKGLPDPENLTGTIDLRAQVTAYVRDDPSTPETPDYFLYE